MQLQRLLPVFLSEADEHLQALEEGVLQLERQGPNPELVAGLFRSAHTLKGSAGALGFQRMAELAHALEEVLEALRAGRGGDGLADLLLECVDTLRALRQEVSDGGERTDVQALVERLRAWKEGGAEDGLPVDVRVRLREDCPMRAARALALLRVLREHAEVEQVAPPEEAIAQGQLELEFTARVRAREPEALQELLAGPEVESVRVMPAGEARDERWLDLGPQARGKLPDDPELTRRASLRTVRVDVERLDRLMNLVGELVVDRIRFQQIAERLRRLDGANGLAQELAEAAGHLGRVASDLQAQVLKARMLPIEHLFSRFPRYVRDLAQRAGKRVEVVVEGQDTELDRSVIEQIGGPLMHLVRNAVDHGIEPPEERQRLGKPTAGRLRLAAVQEEEGILVVVEDDGRGIDTDRVREKAVGLGLLTAEAAARLSEEEAVELIFHPGLSTASQVTDVSGRGVGMDAVRAGVQALGGSVEVETQRGRGTRFTLRLPLTLAIVRALLVSCGGERYAIPLAGVQEIVEVPADRVHRLGSYRATVLRGNALPVVSVHEALGLPAPENPGRLLCVVTGGRRRVGLWVDRVLGEGEIVVKPLGSYLGQVDGVSGATILGDGRVALILDPSALVRLALREEELAHVG
ncbi:MAG: chemotaxis protein CheA [Armatimonadota bacterium]|nr:chemotaxis protein CheA [Armatimonadota bacterium]MDR7399060.1 chemotaxis protein CheA [Armatimonadota bacterium]MDR7405798.1 chemotaxis protein CheA [Armatimonadota bacterium]MDR7413092.1 chemotaxis protein CheA [Armatimonadota bacterium]MDR7432479.1 chemotaxis protein CheA [Armatimonadota bacterium]